ncbi:MAG: thioredoxin family protein [Bacteroidia bacterium]|nr:thioredoxin family protein [Bacteroidia bacterium]
MDSIATIRDSVDVRIFLGTYCPDSKKWVPRFLKLRPSLPISHLEIVSIDTTKKDVKGLAGKAGIRKIPTFIFYKGDLEIGRITEKPGMRLEKRIFRELKNL